MKAWALKPDRAGLKTPTLLSTNCALKHVCKMGRYHLPARIVLRIREDNIYTQCLTLNRSKITWFSFPSWSRFTKASPRTEVQGNAQNHTVGLGTLPFSKEVSNRRSEIVNTTKGNQRGSANGVQENLSYYSGWWDQPEDADLDSKDSKITLKVLQCNHISPGI